MKRSKLDLSVAFVATGLLVAFALPAIDAGSRTDLMGNPVPVDQRGYQRPSPHCGKPDIGAFERQTEAYCLYLPMVTRQAP